MLTKYSIDQRLIFKMMYRNVSYTNDGFHTDFYKETVEDDIWTAVSFSPDPDYNQTDFDIPMNFVPAFFGESYSGRVGASKIFKKGSDIC